MEIRVLPHHEPGLGCPDIPGLVGGTDQYVPHAAERAALFALRCNSDERGEPAPVQVSFEHCLPAPVATAA
jgi:hypothetical protein